MSGAELRTVCAVAFHAALSGCGGPADYQLNVPPEQQGFRPAVQDSSVEDVDLSTTQAARAEDAAPQEKGRDAGSTVDVSDPVDAGSPVDSPILDAAAEAAVDDLTCCACPGCSPSVPPDSGPTDTHLIRDLDGSNFARVVGPGCCTLGADAGERGNICTSPAISMWALDPSTRSPWLDAGGYSSSFFHDAGTGGGVSWLCRPGAPTDSCNFFSGFVCVLDSGL